MNAPEPLFQVPVALKGTVGLLAAAVVSVLDRFAGIEPHLRVAGMILGLCVSFAMLVSLSLGIVGRWRKLRQPATAATRKEADDEAP